MARQDWCDLVLLLIPLFLPVLSGFPGCFTVALMPMRSSTLQAGDKAPDFTLLAANLPQSVSLKECLKSAPMIVEFLRGTW